MPDIYLFVLTVSGQLSVSPDDAEPRDTSSGRCWTAEAERETLPLFCLSGSQPSWWRERERERERASPALLRVAKGVARKKLRNSFSVNHLRTGPAGASGRGVS